METEELYKTIKSLMAQIERERLEHAHQVGLLILAAGGAINVTYEQFALPRPYTDWGAVDDPAARLHRFRSVMPRDWRLDSEKWREGT